VSRFIVLLIALVSVGCVSIPPVPAAVIPTTTPTAIPTDTPFALEGGFPAADSIPGWTPAGPVRLYDRKNLFDLVDGQAEAFFAYGFEQVATRIYNSASGGVMRIEIWQLAAPADAFGLFTFARAGAPADIGNEGDADPGRRLSFWQNRYYIQVSAQLKASEAELWALARAASSALPAGGEQPGLVRRLPSTGLKERAFIFFRQEISIQSEIWLGGGNILGLGPATDGVVARYDLDGATARLLLVQYPDGTEPSARLHALQSSPVKNLVSADARGNLLAAVFGKVDTGVADKLLADVLGGP
jgi:hypothetical protein